MKKRIKIGHAFSDSIYQQNQSFFSSRKNDFYNNPRSIRRLILIIFASLSTVILISKLFFLQIIQGNYYRNISDFNRLRSITIHAPRGIIFDTNGTPLVYNTPGFREVINGKTQTLTQQEALTKITNGDKNLEVDNLRNYPYKDTLSHVLGYIGEISQEELNTTNYQGYSAGDLVGKTGVENEYEKNLRGTDGKILTEVDASGKKQRTLGQSDPIPGQNITLSISLKLQQAVYTAMKNISRGAAIVSTPKGEILAMVSKPSFDPNLFTQGQEYRPDPSSQFQSLPALFSNSSGNPLLNRAITGTYAPGSTFKIVVAAGALEDNIINSTFTIDDQGILKVGKFSFANWYYTQYGRTEGLVDIEKAIQRSNDIFFYKVGQMLGVDRLSAAARSFGAGSILGIDLPGEAKGLVPTKEWKKNVIGEDWYEGDDYHYGIGQGYLLTTPLQVNAWTQAIANKGVLYVPHILKTSNPQIKSQTPLSDQNFTLIRNGMIKACSPGGVAYPLFKFGIPDSKSKSDGKNFFADLNATVSGSKSNITEISIACKTGTAENGNDQTKPHAWITLFAPAYNPQIIVTVLVENGGEGSDAAAPIAKDILTAWFSK